MPLKIPPRPHRPTLPWLRISPSITSLRVQLTSAKSSSSIPLPGSDADRKVASAGPKSAGPKSAGPKSAGPKTSAPRHRFRSASASATKPQTKPQIPRRSSGGLDSGIKNPRERVPVYYTPAVSTPSKTEALRELWRRVMPPVIDTEDARSNSSFSIGRPSEYDHEGIPASPLDNTFHTTTDELHATTGEPEVAGETETTPIKAEIAPVTDAPSLGSPQKRRSDPHTLHHIPPDEDMWRLFECKFGTRNAAQLSAALTMTPPQGLLNNLGLEELRKQCLESQQIIFAQISWASASAERSRVAKLKEQPESSLDALTWEEELHLEMLASNERLLAALRTYDDLRCAAVECETKHRRQATQDSISSVDTMRADGSSRQPPQVLSIDQPIAEDPPPSSQTKVKAVKDCMSPGCNSDTEKG
ncbi:hypothetical protein K438DRAFT_1133615 [Mycena galopus ATCC 62051]|nr:hypothetical protein K438DRAFT_1133615 [Mycena galopus ATCC 62051]